MSVSIVHKPRDYLRPVQQPPADVHQIMEIKTAEKRYGIPEAAESRPSSKSKQISPDFTLQDEYWNFSRIYFQSWRISVIRVHKTSNNLPADVHQTMERKTAE